MLVKSHSHKHPEVEQRVQALEPKTKTLEKTVRDLQHKMKAHAHPHTHEVRDSGVPRHSKQSSTPPSLFPNVVSRTTRVG